MNHNQFHWNLAKHSRILEEKSQNRKKQGQTVDSEVSSEAYEIESNNSHSSEQSENSNETGTVLVEERKHMEISKRKKQTRNLVGKAKMKKVQLKHQRVEPPSKEGIEKILKTKNPQDWDNLFRSFHKTHEKIFGTSTNQVNKSNKSPHTCDNCRKSFGRKDNLLRHRRTCVTYDYNPQM
jgi:hypothetical protein